MNKEEQKKPEDIYNLPILETIKTMEDEGYVTDSKVILRSPKDIDIVLTIADEYKNSVVQTILEVKLYTNQKLGITNLRSLNRKIKLLTADDKTYHIDIDY